MENIFWGALLRFCQAFVASVPTLMIGLVIAGVFRCMLGHAGTRRLFGENSWRSLPQAWLIGMLLPVCSLGVIPVAREMRRAGVSGGVILAFALTAPLFNPISVLYGLTLADPIVILTFSFCSLAIVTVAGLGWDRLFPRTELPASDSPSYSYGLKRILAVGLFAVREIFSPTSIYVFIGLVGVAALSTILPVASLQMLGGHDDLWAPVQMALIAIPVYATPMTAMVQLATMFQHGNSVGAAFALLAFGAGANLGLFAWIAKEFGIGRSLIWIAMLFSIVLLLAYGIDKPLYPKGVDPSEHTHAFDGYCAPFYSTERDAMARTISMLKENIAPHEIVSLGLGLAFLVIGVLLILFDRKKRIDVWLQKTSARKSRFDVELSGTVLGGVALVGLVVLSIVGCYIYYPSPSEIFEEMRMVDTEVATAALTQDWEASEYWIPRYDDWTRKLQVSMFLRGKPLTDYRRAKADVLREKLEELEHTVKEKDPERSRQLGLEVTRAFSRMKAAYQD